MSNIFYTILARSLSLLNARMSAIGTLAERQLGLGILA